MRVVVGSVASRECEPVDAHQCGADGDVEESGGAGAGDLGGELVLHVLEGDGVGKKAI